MEEGGFLKREVLEDVIDSLKVMDIRGWEVCGGGEPLLHRESHSFLKLLNETGRPILLVTNGSFLTEEDAENCRTIRVSLDAGTRWTHEALHGSNDWDKILENIKKASKITRVGVGFLIHPENYKEIPIFTRLCKYLGAQFVHIRPCFTDYPIVRDQVGFNWFTWSKHYEEEIQWYLSLAKGYEDNSFKVYTTFYKVMPKKWLFKKCYALTLNPLISPTGGVWICCERRGVKRSLIGTIGKDGTFYDIWYSKRHEELIENLPNRLCPLKCKYAGYNRAIHEAYIEKSLDLEWI